MRFYFFYTQGDESFFGRFGDRDYYRAGGGVSLYLAWVCAVSTKSAPLPFERKLAGIALQKRIEKRRPRKSPVQPTEPNLLAGAKIYIQDCAVCHGTMTDKESVIAKGMFPEPPPLLTGGGVTDDPVGETYWRFRMGSG